MGDLPPVFILAGGLGTRLQSMVSDRPKVLAEVGCVPFLDLQLKWLERQGIQEVVLLAGYMSEQIASFIGNGSSWDLNIRIIQESTPLGTGGAILNALKKLQTKQEFILLNGDSLAEVSLLNFYENNVDDGLAQIVAVYQADSRRFGTVIFDEKLNLIGFQEKKTHSQEGWINAGIYYFPEGWFESKTFTECPLSLEQDMFPAWLSSEKPTTRVFPIQGYFIDIGTPDSFSLFQEQVQQWHSKLLL